MLTGGCACNENLKLQISDSLQKFEYLPKLLTAPNELNTDNAAMIAWMGHELIHSNQNVDIRYMQVDGYLDIPLGSYVKETLNSKGLKSRDFQYGVGNRKQLVQTLG